MFDLRTHVFTTLPTGETQLVRETPYTRISVAGSPPIYIREGKAYYESGEEVHNPPPEVRAILHPEPGGEQPVEYPRVKFTERVGQYGKKKSPYFEPLDGKFVRCVLCQEELLKRDAGRHLIRQHGEIWRTRNAPRHTNH